MEWQNRRTIFLDTHATLGVKYGRLGGNEVCMGGIVPVVSLRFCTVDSFDPHVSARASVSIR